MSLLKRTIPTPTFRRSDNPPTPTVPAPAFGFRAPFSRQEEPPQVAPAPAAPAAPPATPQPLPPPPAAKKAKPKAREPKPLPDPRLGGRPRNVPTTVRDCKVTISLSQEEVDAMAALAARMGLSFSAWVRYVVFDVAQVVPRPHAERALVEGGA